MEKSPKSRSVSSVDFTELSAKYPQGAGLEALARLLGINLGLAVDWTGLGADEGRDLIFTDVEKGQLFEHSFRWLVQCKDKSVAQRNVSESDVPSILEKLRQHNCQGFLLITTTHVTSGLKKQLDGLGNPCKVWDQHELTNMLFDKKNEMLFLQFFPSSYAKLIAIKQVSEKVLLQARSNFGLHHYESTEEGKWARYSRKDFSIPGIAVEVSFPQFLEINSADIDEVNLLLRAHAVKVIQGLREQRMRSKEDFETITIVDGEVITSDEIDRVSYYLNDFEVIETPHGLLSVVYNVTNYCYPAAHPNHHAETFNFELSPTVSLTLDLILEGEYLEALSTICCNALVRDWAVSCDESTPFEGWDKRVIKAERSDLTSLGEDTNSWVRRGTSPVADNFSCFYMTEAGLVFIFAEGRVNAYVSGEHRVLVPYELIGSYISRDTAIYSVTQAIWHAEYGDEMGDS
jgi:hypothetical protein